MPIHTHLPLAAAALVAAAALLPSPASASTVSYEGATLVLRAAPGERNSLSVQDGTQAGWVSLYDSSVTVTAPPAACTDQSSYGFVECPAPAGVRAELGDGDDRLSVSSGVTTPITALGGPGNDRLEGYERTIVLFGEAGNDVLKGHDGDDQLDGGEGDDELDGSGGADRLQAGPGDDLLHPDHYEAASPDVVDGGPGTDRIEADWSTRLLDDPEPPVTLTLGGGADDGRPGEGDDVQGVERMILSKGARVTGTDAPEYVKLHQVGEPGELIGLGGADELRGGDGADALDGGAGDDALDGGFGDDTIVGGPGRDRISADLAGGDCGPLWCKFPYGNDTVQARDGEADSITCGAGTDRVLADAADTVAPDCETVERGTADTAAPPTGAAPETGGGPGTGATVLATRGQRLRTALRRGLKVRVTGAGGRVRVRALQGTRTVASGRGAAGDTITLRFTATARRALARKRSVRLTVVTGTVRTAVTLRR